MADWGGAEYAAVCSHCLAHRTEIASMVLARLCEGKRRTQIDCGDDVVFGGITPVVIPEAGPCPACGSSRHMIAVWPETAQRFGPKGIGPPRPLP
jgi:hypothetical protein